MDDFQLNFETFFRERVKEKGLTLKKIADMTGISLVHLESMARGDFEHMPSAPYFRGYLLRLSRVLDFNADEWWEEIKKEGIARVSGPLDALPRNRFVRKSPAKFIILGIIGVAIVAYAVFQVPRMFGRPELKLTFPAQNPYVTSSSTITLAGTVKGADALYLNGEPVTINVSEGSWQKTVLLGGDAPNTYQITAKKFLGGQVDITEQVIYQAPAGASSTASSTATSSVPEGHAGSETVPIP